MLIKTTMPKESAQTVALGHHALTENECKCYLGRNVIKKGIQPVLITISNNTNKHFILSKENLSLACERIDAVAKKVHTSTVGRAVGYGIAGIFIWPFIIPAIVDGIRSSEANHELDSDYTYKALSDQIIAPDSTVSGLVFVPMIEYTENFSWTLIDQDSGDRFVLKSNRNEITIK